LSSWKILSLAALCLMQERLPYEGTIPTPTILPRLDVACMLKTWRIKGVLYCPWQGNMKPCLWVENAYPCGLLEVVRQPFRSHLPEFPPIPMRGATFRVAGGLGLNWMLGPIRKDSVMSPRSSLVSVNWRIVSMPAASL